MQNHRMYFLVGASGSGKTTVIKEVEKMNLPNLQVFYFDSIGIPSFEDMKKEYGSTDEWQRTMTKEWLKRMKRASAKNRVVLDGQIRPSFILEACKEQEIEDYKIILFDCADDA